MEINYPLSYAKARRLSAKAAATPELWNWLTDRSKRELAEMLLDAISEKHARAIFRKLEREGRI